MHCNEVLARGHLHRGACARPRTPIIGRAGAVAEFGLPGVIEAMSTTPTDRATKKARAIFVRAFGARGGLLFKSSSTAAMMETIVTAFARRMNRAKAADVGFHLGDWASEASLVVALHMFPERFTPEEVRYVANYLAAGLPYHCAALGAHFGYEGLARSGIREVKQPKRLR
jgi:hypothetical protein